MEEKNREIWREITDPNYGYIVIFLSVIFFYVLSMISTVFQAPCVVQKSKWKWKNISVSFVHSNISSIWAVSCFCERPDMAEDLITIFTPLSHNLVAFSVGYFVHDLIDLMTNQRKRQSLELICHHVVSCLTLSFDPVLIIKLIRMVPLSVLINKRIYGIVRNKIITCFMVAVSSRHYVGYAVVALLVELNSVFLHLRQLLQICGVSKFNPWYRFNSLINLATFIVFRILLLSWMTRWLVINKDALPLVFYTLGSLGLAVMVAMNIILFYRLLRSDFISLKETDDSKKVST